MPDATTRIQVDATGGDGASSVYGKTTIPGGIGGRVAATISVKPYERLLVYVGGNGSGPIGGFNGGAGGGPTYQRDAKPVGG